MRARKLARHAAGSEGMTVMALAKVFERIAGPDAPVEFRAYDGSEAGVAGAPVRITIRSPVALSYIAQAPGSLGLARAYVTGHLDLDGDMYTALTRMSTIQQVNLSPAERLRLLNELGGPKLLYPRVPPPSQEVRIHRRWMGGHRHSKGRDASAIAHHYDVSNTFYEWVLGPSMAYTCACYPDEDATLEQAQTYKHELVARKLALRPGMRLGRDGPARRARARGQGAGGDPVRAAGRMGTAGDRARRLVRARRGASPGLPERDRNRVRRRELHRPDRAHRQGPATGLLLLPVRQAEAGRQAAQSLHHPAGQLRAVPPGRRFHQPVRVPGRGTGRARPSGVGHERGGFRDPARGEPARALRADAGGLVREPGCPLGRSRRRGRAGHRQGMAAVYGRLAP